MMRLATLVLMLLPMAAQADFTLSDLLGTWSGSGTYYERPSKARMKCRLSFAGNDSQVRMTGRCGSSLGAQDLTLDFIRQGSNGVIVRSPPGATQSNSDIAEMQGQMSGNYLIAAGSAGAETAKFQFESKADGTLAFVTEHKDGTFFSQSVVTLSRR